MGGPPDFPNFFHLLWLREFRRRLAPARAFLRFFIEAARCFRVCFIVFSEA